MLAGFKLGEYSEPSELVMYLNITLKDEEMCSSFVEAIKKIGYEENKEFIVNGNTVGLTFDKRTLLNLLQGQSRLIRSYK